MICGHSTGHSDVRGLPGGRCLSWPGPTPARVWVAARASLRAVLDHVSIADVIDGKLPAAARRLTAAPDAWRSG